MFSSLLDGEWHLFREHAADSKHQNIPRKDWHTDLPYTQ